MVLRHVIYYKRKNPPQLKSLPPTNMNLALHIRRAHLQIMLWKAADKANPPAVKITDYGWDVDANNEVMPVLSREPIAPEQLMDVISCSCHAEGKACSGRCSCVANGLSCTNYCQCEGAEECFNPLTQRVIDEGDEEEEDEEDKDLEKRDADDEDTY